MSYPYPVAETLAEGHLDVGDGHQMFWQTSGNPEGKPAVLLHGGPGSGSSPRHRRLFDPDRYLIVQFDQRGCGQSTPSASAVDADLSTNTTQHLIADIEVLRETLNIEQWVVWGGSWGTTLGLAYAQTYPNSVSALLLSSVVTSSHAEVDWITRTMGRLFPERWREFVDFLPEEQRNGNLAVAYHRQLMDPDPDVHNRAALMWCDWEDVHVSLVTGHEPYLRTQDPEFRLCFARLVTHYWANAGFLAKDSLLDDGHKLAAVPTLLAHGRHDVSSPAGIAFEVADHIPGAELFIAEAEGHGGPSMSLWISAKLDDLAAPVRHDLPGRGPDHQS